MFEKILEWLQMKAPEEGLHNVVIMVITQGKTVSGSVKTYKMPKQHLVGLEKILLAAEGRLVDEHAR